MHYIKTKLIHKKDVANYTLEFHLEKPDGYIFRAGQHTNIKLVHPLAVDEKGDSREFCFASAPHEDALIFVTRIRDTAFKNELRTMSPGKEILITPSAGGIVLHEDSTKPAVFIAGGVGIAPFKSILCHAQRHGLKHKISLFYSNRIPEDASYLSEFKEMEKYNTDFTFVPTMTKVVRSSIPWEGESQYITYEMIANYHPQAKESLFYISGSPEMVISMKTLLRAKGIPEEHIQSEEFTGY